MLAVTSVVSRAALCLHCSAASRGAILRRLGMRARRAGGGAAKLCVRRRRASAPARLCVTRAERTLYSEKLSGLGTTGPSGVALIDPPPAANDFYVHTSVLAHTRVSL